MPAHVTMEPMYIVQWTLNCNGAHKFKNLVFSCNLSIMHTVGPIKLWYKKTTVWFKGSVCEKQKEVQADPEKNLISNANNFTSIFCVYKEKMV